MSDRGLIAIGMGALAWISLGLPGAVTARAQQYPLIGSWEGTTTVAGLPVTSDATLGADGSFRMTASADPALAFDVAGTYIVDAARQVIRFQSRSWAPQQECLPGLDFQLHCADIEVPRPLDVRYRFLSPDSMVVDSPQLTLGPVQYQRVR